MKLKTIEERRKSDRERLKRWRQNQLAAGNKQIQLMITPEAQAVLQAEKERTGESFISIIHRAIIGLKKTSMEIPEKPAAKADSERQAIKELIFKMNAEGKDEWEISSTFNEEGVQTIDAKEKWYPSSVRTILEQKR